MMPGPTMLDQLCPECGASVLFYGGSWCASCGWHARHQTTQHADFAPDASCRWCFPEPDGSAPWDRADGCFGHCDREGWYAPCRRPEPDDSGVAQ